MNTARHNYEWFRDNLSDLMKEHYGKYLVIQDESCRGAYETCSEAITASMRLARLGSLIVERCVSVEEHNACTMYAPVFPGGRYGGKLHGI
jgi:hypothetical protein